MSEGSTPKQKSQSSSRVNSREPTPNKNVISPKIPLISPKKQSSNFFDQLKENCPICQFISKSKPFWKELFSSEHIFWILTFLILLFFFPFLSNDYKSNQTK